MYANDQSGIRTTVSYERDSMLAAREIASSLRGKGLGFVLFFCSSEYELKSLGLALEREFKGVLVAGCTTAGEITPDGYAQGCITAVGFCDQGFNVSGALISDLQNFNVADAQDVVSGLIQDCHSKGVASVKGNTFALTLLDGLSSREENVLDALNTALGSLPNFGGSAGDDTRLSNTHVFFGGLFHDRAAVILLFNTHYKFEVFTTHHMVNCDNKLVVTAADSGQRRVYELNTERAAIAYAKTINVPVDELTNLTFALNPIGVKFGEDYYVRSIQRVHPDKSMTFYCAIENGIVLTRMQPQDMLSNLGKELNGIHRRIGASQLILGCDCFLNRVEMEHLGLTDEGSMFMKNNKVIGFGTYGEQVGGMHVNQTFTGVSISFASR